MDIDNITRFDIFKRVFSPEQIYSIKEGKHIYLQQTQQRLQQLQDRQHPRGRRRDDDPVFSTPTSKADLGLKLALIQQRHYANVPEPITPTCGADVERELVAMKKQQDDIFDDYAFIMRKAGKWMDEQKVKIEKMERDCAQLRAQAAELEGEGQQAETSSVPETTSASGSLENSRGRKRKSIGEGEGSEAQRKRA